MTHIDDVEETTKRACEIADGVGSPWGEGATYEGDTRDIPKLNVERDIDNGSHLDDSDWKSLVEAIVNLVNITIHSHDTKLRTALLEKVGEKKPKYDVSEKHGKETNCSFHCHCAGELTALENVETIINDILPSK